MKCTKVCEVVKSQFISHNKTGYLISFCYWNTENILDTREVLLYAFLDKNVKRKRISEKMVNSLIAMYNFFTQRKCLNTYQQIYEVMSLGEKIGRER